MHSATAVASRTENKVLERYRAEFPITAKYAYLDHANVAPLPQRTVVSIAESLASQATEGSLIHLRLHEIAEEARAEFATLIGAKPGNVGYVASTSAGISLIAQGLKLKAGDEVVVPAIDFPSAVLPWVLLERGGVIVHRVQCVNGRVAVQDLINAFTARTRVVSTSWVQFSSGYKLDLEKLGDACRKRGIFLIVDGMQGVGAIQINVSQLPIDALITQGYKWLVGPQGIGWLYMTDVLSAATELTAAGVRTSLPRESYYDHRLEPRKDVTRFESGILNFHGIVGAMTSQKLLMEIGLPEIEAKVIDLSDRLRHGLTAAGCEVIGATDSDAARSQIVAFRHPQRNSQELNSALLRSSIVTSVRENCIRVSPHFYNTNQEIDSLLRLLS